MSTKSVSDSLNMSIFKQDIIYTDPDKSCDGKCGTTKRLSVALKYYQCLDISNNQQHRDVFINFVEEVYPHLLNDIVHFHNNHGHEIEIISNNFMDIYGFSNCDTTNCSFTSRHHRHGVNHNQTQIDLNLEFYQQSMDALHFYIFHMFDCGLRQSTKPIISIQSNDDQFMDLKCYDADFARMRQSISDTNCRTASFERFGKSNNSKFTIKTEFDINVNDEDDIIEQEQDVNTYLESLYYHLEKNNIEHKIIQRLQNFVRMECFDTDSVFIDISDMLDKGNISKCIQDKKSHKLMKDFVESSQSMLYSGLAY